MTMSRSKINLAHHPDALTNTLMIQIKKRKDYGNRQSKSVGGAKKDKMMREKLCMPIIFDSLNVLLPD